MPNSPSNSLLDRAWRGALVLCGIAVLLSVAVDVIRRIWIDLAVMVGAIAAIVVIVSVLVSWRRRQRW